MNKKNNSLFPGFIGLFNRNLRTKKRRTSKKLMCGQISKKGSTKKTRQRIFFLITLSNISENDKLFYEIGPEKMPPPYKRLFTFNSRNV